MKIKTIFTIIVIILVTIIMILAYNIDGVDVGALWCFFIPLVILRYIRVLLLWKDAIGNSQYMKQLRKQFNNNKNKVK